MYLLQQQKKKNKNLIKYFLDIKYITWSGKETTKTISTINHPSPSQGFIFF